MKKAFTLIELLIVMVLMCIIIGISVPMFSGLSQGSAIRGATRSIASVLSLTRQWAITHRVETGIYYFTVTSNGTPYSYYYIKDIGGTYIQKEERLPDGVIFYIDDITKNRAFGFKTDGGLTVAGTDVAMELADVKKPDTVVKRIIVNWLTGGVRVQD